MARKKITTLIDKCVQYKPGTTLQCGLRWPLTCLLRAVGVGKDVWSRRGNVWPLM